ncbi:hypothetical protein [Faecalitalea cylindroides]|uniref:hypothetical protein n=1 Tax=Faecalitalea cylindroides TaxID=39483 RepID=UPI0022E30497|nr:hypothetical protein [Faecalitalea cylindroides]
MALDTNGEKNGDKIDKELRAPFVIDKDIKYYSDLEERYELLIKRAKECGADKESIEILNEYTDGVLDSIQKYYDGDIVSAQNRIKKINKRLY